MKLASSRIIVIGGGISGITAAWRLRQAGARVTLIEARSYLGGRLASHHPADLPTAFDNGPHLFLSTYTRARRLFRELGIEDAFEYPYPGAIAFVREDRIRGMLREWPLPAPLNFMGGLLSFSLLSWAARQRTFGAARDILAQPHDWQIDAGQWLDGHSEPEERVVFWEPLIRAAMNAGPADIPAAYLRTVLKQGFCQGAFGGRLGYAGKPLARIFDEQVRIALELAGIRVLTNSASIGPLGEAGVVSGVRLKSGESLGADAVVAALPPWALADWLKETSAGERVISEYRLREWRANPVTSIYFWGEDRPLLDGYTCLPGRRAQWVFDFARLWGDRNAPVGIIVDNTAAGAQQAAPQQLLQKLISAFPQLGPVRWTHWKSITEKRATPLRPRELWGQVLPQATPLRGLYLAGDWLDPELPPTVEAGVRAGERVANLTLP